MRRIWVVVVALVGALLATDARADTVYFADGQSIWGREAYEEGDSVVIVRPGGDLRVPKSRVSRIERAQSSLPPFYSPPAAAPAAPGAPAQAGVPGPPGAPGGGASPSPPPGGASPATPPSGGAPAQLPPPPPPPSPGR